MHQLSKAEQSDNEGSGANDTEDRTDPETYRG